MFPIKYHTDCSLSGKATEDLADQRFKILVGSVPAGLYFKLCYLADLNRLSLAEVCRRLLAAAVADVSFKDFEQPKIKFGGNYYACYAPWCPPGRYDR